MNHAAARQFIRRHARPVDLAVYEVLFENAPSQGVVKALSAYQNKDGGFGHGLEADFFNPHSSPIATNDALITLFRTSALDPDADMVKGMVRYLTSHDSFDEEKRRWLFAIDSNKDYPHAIWWEKKGDGIDGFNPTISLAAFLLCYGSPSALCEDILREGMVYLEKHKVFGADPLKCYLLCYELLIRNQVTHVIDLARLKNLLQERIRDAICTDVSKYGVEYVPLPSDFFSGTFLEFITPEIAPLIEAEKAILGRLQKEDGGFDISWKWYTDYPQFEHARAMWRPRVTIEKLLFACATT